LTILRRHDVDRLIDRARFAIDTAPALDYQPLPWLGKHRARRAAGVESRWQAMSEVIDAESPATAVDVGANVGFFSIQLAKRGVSTIAVEMQGKYFRPLLFARERLGLKEHLGLLTVAITPDTTWAVPRADCMLFLSVWHHLVRSYGQDAATTVLAGLWERTAAVLFFETGQAEMPPSYGLPPFEPTPVTFLENYLRSVCNGGVVEHLGAHRAFAPDGTIVDRELFAVRR
jgi:hypothetical protein